MIDRLLIRPNSISQVDKVYSVLSHRVGMWTILIILSSLITSCGFPTHFIGSTAKVEKKGTLSMLVGGSLYSFGKISGTPHTNLPGITQSNSSQLNQSVRRELPLEILSPEASIKWVALPKTEIQLHSNIYTTQRITIRHQILGNETSIFALSIGLGYLRNAIKSQKIRDIYIPIYFSFHTKNQKLALYGAANPLLRKYQNLSKNRVDLYNYYYVNFIPIASQFMTMDYRGGIWLKVDERASLVGEIGTMSNNWGWAKQISVGINYKLNK